MATVVHRITTTPQSEITTTPSESASQPAYRLFVKGAAEVILARSVA